uniref:unique cartilage matrix-associated protein isoform X2 n=1 Tax=Halichoerus grypus TaxID=9711 RepID=UPI001659F83E|nr:unique cartilage matrix-associated protein isoform X2 [Halichoerus grypus]
MEATAETPPPPRGIQVSCLPPSWHAWHRREDLAAGFRVCRTLSALWFPNRASAPPTMAWRQLLMASCLSAAVLLTMLQEGTGASVGTQQVAGQKAQEDVEQKIFMQELDASNFLKKRGKRSPKSRDEASEQEERSREAIEQWRQWHYDGLYPSYLQNRHRI